MKEEVVVIGAGGHGKVVVSTLIAAGYIVSAVYDDDPKSWGKKVLNVPVAGGTDLLKDGSKAIIGIGNNRIREQISERFPNIEWITVHHPASTLDPSVTAGKGTVVFAGSVIQPDSRIGDHCIVNTSASVDHDCEIGDFVHIAPGVRIAGGVTISEGALLGIGSHVIPGIRIGSWSVVGAGAAVIRDVLPRSTVIGVPARVRRK